jgi:dissimilatory sulfite reductase alpha subunit
MSDVPRGEDAERLPMCERLSEGRYPSYSRELRQSRFPIRMVEEGFVRNRTQWSSGGYISVPPLLAGIAVTGSSRPDISPEVTTLRLLGVPGGFLSPRLMRSLADMSEKFGDGHLRWTTAGSIEFPVRRAAILDAVTAANEAGLDVGSTGDDIRNVAACPGSYRCDLALVNAPDIAFALGQAFIDDQQYPGLPNKLKTVVSGCPNDCVRAQMQKDHAFVGVFRGTPVVDHEAMARWIAQGGSGMASVGSAPPVGVEYLIRNCPGSAIECSGDSINIDGDACRHCMLCINRCPAIGPGPDRGVAWVAGGKYGHRGANGPMTGFVLADFIPAIPPDYADILDLYRRFLDLYADRGRRKERVGDMLVRMGLKTVLELMDLEPNAAILEEPTSKMFLVWPSGEGVVQR